MQWPVRSSMSDVQKEWLLLFLSCLAYHTTSFVINSVGVIEIISCVQNKFIIVNQRRWIIVASPTSQCSKMLIKASLDRRWMVLITGMLPPVLWIVRWEVATHMPFATHHRSISSHVAK